MSDIKILIDTKQTVFDATGVDVENLANVSDEMLLEAHKMASLAEKYYAQVSVTEKRFMNSIYGATGAVGFDFCNFNTAEDICLEGQYYINKGQDTANNYLMQKWHLDTDTHNKLYERFGREMFTGDLTAQLPVKDYVVYIDTDSIYIEFHDILTTTGWQGDSPTFIRALNEFVLRDEFEKALGSAVKRRNGTNYLKFDLESVSSIGFYLAKKKYLLAEHWVESVNIVWDDPHNHLKGKGIEIARNEFSQLAIKMIKFILKEIVMGTLTRANYKAYMRNAFKIFSDPKLPIHECCKFVNLKHESYAKILKQDATGVEFAPKCLPQARGAAWYNHLVEKNGLQEYYQPIRGGVKVGWYVTTAGTEFAFDLNSEFPYDIAPECDRHAMFDKVIAKPINRFATLAGFDVDNYLSESTQIKI